VEAPLNPSANQSTYFINPEEAEETTRLLLQDRLLTKEMGGVFPEGLDPSQIYLVLDLACGPGGWACDVARLYPQMDIIGVDISEKMMRYARAHAQAQRLDNASFQVMSVLNPLEFPDAAFDFVNARLLSGFMPMAAWPSFVQECIRITRPGGIIRLTEGEWQFANGAAFERIADMLMRAMWLDGKSFSPDGKRVGATLMISQFLRESGLLNLQHQAYGLDFSFGTEAHETTYQNFMMGYPLLSPFLVKKGVTTKEEYAQLCDQISVEMQEPTFRGLWFLLSVWGTKPSVA
jgi:ubiquinone/menaquinone biosynthesis C-methylase UbiE